MIYTTYFGNIKNLPKDIIPIAVCLNCPKSYKGLHYPKLAPKYYLLRDYKITKDIEYYTTNYSKDTLSSLSPEEVIDDLLKLSNLDNLIDYDIALVCFEKPDSFCHRILIAKWFRKHGYFCEEYINKLKRC